MNRRLFAQAIAMSGPALAAAKAVDQQVEAAPRNPTRASQGQRPEPAAGDLHRPGFHFLPPQNWMNDPNGLVFHRGWYHLFYQHNPGAAVWGDMHWGHAASRDLLHWKHLPIALAPTPGGYDKDGVFSGCTVVDGNVASILYTGTKPEVQALATSEHPLLETWTKYEKNPIIGAPPKELEVTGFRDPFVWKEGEDWLMVVGSGIKGRGGAILLYRSSDLRAWEYLHPLVQSDDPALGTMWECPNFFPLGNKHVLLISPVPLRKAFYAIGNYVNRRFEIETVESLDDGGHFYAPQTFLDSANRRVMFGWSWEGRSQEAQVEAGWAGVQTLPRVLSLEGNSKLRMEPHPFCQRLTRFGKALRSMPFDASLNREMREQSFAGNSGRLDVVVQLEGKAEFCLSFLRSPDGLEETRLVYRPESGELLVDRTKSSLDKRQYTKPFVSKLLLRKDELLNITLYLDRSMVEAYINGNCCLTTRVYPSCPDSKVFFFAAAEKHRAKEIRWRPIAARPA